MTTREVTATVNRTDYRQPCLPLNEVRMHEEFPYPLIPPTVRLERLDRDVFENLYHQDVKKPWTHWWLVWPHHL